MCVGGRLFTGLILLASFGASPCLSLESSGEAVAVVQATSATGLGGKRILAETQPVYSGDTISTGGAGLAQIRFRDETRLVVGPNSNVVIDRFVLASDSSASGASIRFAKGTFRFITGSGASSNYRLQTPTATVGIRGTELDITVGGKSGTAVVVYEGAVEVCSRSSGRCAIIDNSCAAAHVPPGGGVSVPNSRMDRSALINASFPMARNQSALRRGFKVNTGGCGNPQGSPPAKGTQPQKAGFRMAPAPPPDPDPEPPPSKPHKGHHHHHGKHKDRHDRHHARHDHGRKHGEHADNRRGHRAGEHGRRGGDEGRGKGRDGRHGGDRSGKGGDHGRGDGHGNHGHGNHGHSAGNGGGHAGAGHGPGAGRGGEGRGGEGRGSAGRGTGGRGGHDGHGASRGNDSGGHAGRGGGGRGDGGKGGRGGRGGDGDNGGRGGGRGR